MAKKTDLEIRRAARKIALRSLDREIADLHGISGVLERQAAQQQQKLERVKESLADTTAKRNRLEIRIQSLEEEREEFAQWDPMGDPQGYVDIDDDYVESDFPWAVVTPEGLLSGRYPTDEDAHACLRSHPEGSRVSYEPDATFGDQLVEDVTIYAEADRLVIYDDGIEVDTRAANPARKTEVAKIAKPGHIDQDDIENALEYINARRENPGSYTVIDIETLDVLESSTYSAN